MNKVIVMLYQEFIPAPPVSDFVECIWAYESPNEAEQPVHRWLPNGVFDLVFNLGSVYERINVLKPELRQQVVTSAVIGQMKESVKIVLGEKRKVLGIRFKPYGLYAFLGMPIGELTEKSFSLEDLLGIAGQNWYEKIVETNSQEAQLHILEQFLRIRFSKNTAPDPIILDAVNRIRRAKGLYRIAELSKQYSITQRTLENRFNREVGLSPKELARIWRFNHFLLLSIQKSHLNCTELAYACDFTDQSHLIRDFKSITALSPYRFLREYSDLVSINQQTMYKRFEGAYY
jgi:AraC-like DNA-binding protein